VQTATDCPAVDNDDRIGFVGRLVDYKETSGIVFDDRQQDNRTRVPREYQELKIKLSRGDLLIMVSVTLGPIPR
jgi:hypothetical protein